MEFDSNYTPERRQLYILEKSKYSTSNGDAETRVS
jgi:hypothetical protein